MEHNKVCKECGSKDIVKKGKRKNKYETVQKYFCNNCNEYFTLKKLEKKLYPARVIMQAISYYNFGYSLDESSKLVNKKFKVKVSSRVIGNWLKEFNGICSYYRIRSKAKVLFKPEDIIFKKIFRHLQLYKYRYHKAKLEFFVNEYYNGLKNYLNSISENCPNELFKASTRSSNVKLNIDADKIKIFKKENYACRLASLALESASKNSERHDKLQEFMLANDTCTIATEVPIYLHLDEIKEYGVLDLIDKISIKNSLNEKYNNELKNKKGGNGRLHLLSLVKPSTHPVKIEQQSAALNKPIEAEGGGELRNRNEEQSSSIPPIENKSNVKEFNEFKNNPVITGHIDFVQLKFGSVYVLDYKPEASKVDAVSQLFVYAVALSVRTGIWLRNFRCAWFDEKGYYEFVPSDIVLKFCKVPQNRFREFFVRNKERKYFTSKEFQQKRNLRFKGNNNLRNIISHNICSIAQSNLDMIFGKRGKIIFDDFVLGYASTKQLKNLPEHYSSAIKGNFSVADFAVCNDVFVDFDSHKDNYRYGVFKGFADIIEEDEEELENIRPYLLGILLSKATKGRAGGIVTSDRAISFVSKNKLVSKKFDILENDENANDKRGGS